MTARVVRRVKTKYGAVRTVVDGITFASRAEARHYGELRLREKAGEICHLALQVRYPLLVDGVRIGYYISDFEYDDVATGQHVVVDVKGRLTPIYRRSKKHMKAQYGIEIVEVKAT